MLVEKYRQPNVDDLNIKKDEKPSAEKKDDKK
jgi:hypothetical protein